MKEENIVNKVLMKVEVKLAFDVFKQKFKKISRGIEKIYQNLVLSDNFEDIKKAHKRFFGYIKKSKKAKEKWMNGD